MSTPQLYAGKIQHVDVSHKMCQMYRLFNLEMSTARCNPTPLDNFTFTDKKCNKLNS